MLLQQIKSQDVINLQLKAQEERFQKQQELFDRQQKEVAEMKEFLANQTKQLEESQGKYKIL